MAAVIHRTTLEFRPAANEPDFPEPTWKHNPDMTAVAGVLRRFWKWDAVGERPVPMTAPEQAAVVAAELEAQRENQAANLDQPEALLRAVVLILLDELNLHAARTNALLSAIDAATSLGTLKTAVALIADVPTRTVQQLRTAIRARMGT